MGEGGDGGGRGKGDMEEGGERGRREGEEGRKGDREEGEGGGGARKKRMVLIHLCNELYPFYSCVIKLLSFRSCNYFMTKG